jgi:hypothetical protein
MDIAAFHALIAQIPGTTAELAAAEQGVAAFKAELAQQAHGAQSDGRAAVEAIPVIPKRARFRVVASHGITRVNRGVLTGVRLSLWSSGRRSGRDTRRLSGVILRGLP